MRLADIFIWGAPAIWRLMQENLAFYFHGECFYKSGISLISLGPLVRRNGLLPLPCY
jgi:predicted acetyltransferase